ncbi:MAG: OadG family protein [Lachnospiraceae bacterium]|nr:OadG family protein [Lachnospiraceae bacterium]
MKQKIKRIWLALCVVLCLFALGGCGKKAEEAGEIDPQIQMMLEQGVPQTLDTFASMTDEDLEEQLAQATKQKDSVLISAFQSWESVRGDLGGLVSNEMPVIELAADGYVARMNTVFEQRACEFTVFVDENLTITSISFNPEYTVSEKMVKAAMNMLMGMGIVFLVLIFISWLISLFKYIHVFEDNVKKKEAASAQPAPAPQAAPIPAPAAVEESDDLELISVIAAAIAASQGMASADGLVVRSIKRVPNRNWK